MLSVQMKTAGFFLMNKAKVQRRGYCVNLKISVKSQNIYTLILGKMNIFILKIRLGQMFRVCKELIYVGRLARQQGQQKHWQRFITDFSRTGDDTPLQDIPGRQCPEGRETETSKSKKSCHQIPIKTSWKFPITTQQVTHHVPL